MNRQKPKLAPDLAKRADRLTATIATLKAQIQEIIDSGEVAPKGCYVARYQVRQRLLFTGTTSYKLQMLFLSRQQIVKKRVSISI